MFTKILFPAKKEEEEIKDSIRDLLALDLDKKRVHKP